MTDVLPQLLFLPGASGAGAFWEPVRRELPEFDAVALDWPGVGEVGPDPDGAIDGYDALVALTAGHVTRPSVLVAQSMGGLVAVRVALARPGLVTHLVLAVTSAGLDVDALGARDWRPEVRASNPENPEWLYEPQPHLDAVLPSLAVPVLLVWASDDPISPLAVGERLAALLPNSRLVVYESDDHWVARERAVDVAREMRALVKQR